ncbi:uncharacterized protein NECHADRAFT_87088 [Fusarium vanettenii 77-13-4]|uniref:Hydrophobin n=1 Tax=Fusarium vanettenii (strain ATCC MYA-4622 / CBS 123669 / FGSC 9596 / NRRL 45880 / 77-13-4) TaxID=660122 RepID=C7ZIB8_FUSV7|nr:uncharacterized protein NECHADRAFT_87088 [Fusarium vanettenii 77-13-4]EEU36233.1 hypothetical protein NECHADRAFT_87088 [Fusarium vanettenii 77-13-4]
MVNVATFSAAVVACFASFGAARNCTPSLYYCGSSLLDIGNYYDDIEDALAATKQGICADRRTSRTRCSTVRLVRTGLSSTRVTAPRVARTWALVKVASVKGSVEFIQSRRDA